MSAPPDAVLLLTSHCPHCPAVLRLLADLVKEGALGRLTVENLEVHPETAGRYGARAVPWLKIGPFELTGPRDRQELLRWARLAGDEAGMADWFHLLLKEGDLAKVLATVRQRPDTLAALLAIVANPEASLNVRIGAGAGLEEMAGTPALAALVPRLGELSRHADARVRADACHYLGLSGDPAARSWLRQRLTDPDAETREIAEESLALLPEA